MIHANHNLCLARAVPALGITLAAAILLAAQDKSLTYGKTLPLGSQVVQFGETCVGLKAIMSADDFFVGLKRVSTSRGPEFYSHGNRVIYYPDHVSVEILAVATGCRGPLQAIPVFQAVRDMLASIQFKGLWDRKEGAQPIDTSPLKTARGLPWTEFAESWDYIVEVGTREVPLTDHLALEVLASNGDKLARFGAEL